jgi:hypothetical protein
MAEALSNAAGHNYSRPARVQEEPPTFRQPAATATRIQNPPSRVGKKPVTGFFEPTVSRQLKRIGLDHDRTMQDLIAEALNDLFRKYEQPPIAR